MAYPNKIDTVLDLPTAIDNLTPVSGKMFNALRTAILAVQSELGVKPSGTHGTIRARLDYIDLLFQNLNAVTLGQDLGGTTNATLVVGLQGNPLSSATPNFGDTLMWDGLAWTPTVSSSGPYASQSEWHIDSVNGNDSNTGLDINHKIKTFKEFHKRTGIPWEVTVNVTIYVYEDVPADDVAIFNIINCNAAVKVVGIPKVKRSITLTSWRARNTATNTPNGMTASGISSWQVSRGLDFGDNVSGELGSQGLFKITSGANVGAYIWPIKNEGGGIARLTEGGVPIANDNLNEDFLGAMNGNETMDQLRLPIISSISFVSAIGTIADSVAGPCSLQLLQFSTPDKTFAFDKFVAVQGSGFCFKECIFSGSDVVMQAVDTLVTNCIIASIVLVPQYKIYFTQGALINSLIFPQKYSNLEFGRYNLVQGGSLNTQEGLYAITSHTRGIGIFDSSATILNFSNNSIGILNGPLWGTNNTGYGIVVGKSCIFSHDQDQKTISCSLGDMLIGTRNTLPAYDDSSDTWTSARSTTFSLLSTSVSGGGFGQNIAYPAGMCGVVTK